MFLSIVIIAKNEEGNISHCIESILKCIGRIEDTEILLVDSCSSDRTVEIAQKYPINIISLRPEWKLSPAAGRFNGVNNTTGKYILIIDGDMELLDGWLKPALQFIDTNPNVGAVVGKRYDIYCLNNGNYSNPHIAGDYKNITKLKKIDYVFGSAVFRREGLLKSGNFHPFLRAEEEAEISYRLSKQGYELYFLPYDAIYHYCIPKNTFQETIRRTKNKLWAGFGDLIAWSLQKRYYLLIWNRCKLYIAFLIFLILSLGGALYFAIQNNIMLSSAFASMPLLFLVLMCIKKRSIYQGTLSGINILIISLNIIGGMFRKVGNIYDYPQNITWLKRINNCHCIRKDNSGS
jgi:glycosyltransferase involved in cell wall biosynthesis